MKYFLDTEFIEGFHKPFLGKRRHFIDLISIGIVAEDGREYYAISNEFNPKDADPWVIENVLDPMVHSWVLSWSGDGRNHVLNMIEGKGKIGAIKVMQREIGKSNEVIKKDIIEFTNPKLNDLILRTPEFYAYYADYDWVVLCSLFGRMIDLPKFFPMYCNDLKQTLDEKAKSLDAIQINNFVYKSDGKLQLMPATEMLLSNYSIEERLILIKAQKTYPTQENEHSAIDDARWNKALYYFLKTI